MPASLPIGYEASSRPTRSLTLALLFAAVCWGPGAGRLCAAESAPPAVPAVTSSDTQPDGQPEAGAEPAEHGLPRNAVEIARPLGFPITNSMVVTWVVALGLIAFAQFATRDMQKVPGGAQNFFEWLVAGLYGLLEGIMGRHLVNRTFWFFATVFIFILSLNWAQALIDFHEQFATGGPDSGADYKAWELMEPMDSDMKLAVWQILQPQSKVRSWLKRISDERRKAA